MKKGSQEGFSLVEVLISLVIVCIVIDMIFMSFIYSKRQYVNARYKQEAVSYGQEMLQYVWHEMSVKGRVGEEDLKAYLRDRPEVMSDYTYSFIWIPFSYGTHKVKPTEITSALRCSTESTFNWNSVEDALAKERLALETYEQKGGGAGRQKKAYWLVGIIGRKQGEGIDEGLQYLVTYQ